LEEHAVSAFRVKMSVSAHKAAQCHNPKQHNLKDHHFVNLKTYREKVVYFVIQCNGVTHHLLQIAKPPLLGSCDVTDPLETRPNSFLPVIYNYLPNLYSVRGKWLNIALVLA
jgi:hypothetical protein